MHVFVLRGNFSSRLDMTRIGQTWQHPTNCTIHRCAHSQTTNPNPTKSLEDKKNQSVIITRNSSLVASAWNVASSSVCSCISVSARTCPQACRTFPWRRASRVLPLRWSEGGRRRYGKLQLPLASHDRFQKGTSRGGRGGACLGVRDRGWGEGVVLSFP
jgi:hypothetical protein